MNPSAVPPAPGAPPRRAPAINDLGQLAAYEEVDFGLYVVHRGMVRYVNPKAAWLLGRPIEELVGRPHEAVLPPSAIEASRRMVAATLAAESTGAVEMSWRRPDGSEVDVRASPGLTSLGVEPVVWVALFDTSALREALRSASRHADMLHNAELLCQLGSFDFTIDRPDVAMSVGLLSLLGLPAEVAHDKRDFLGMIPAQDREFVRGIWESALPDESFDFRHRIETADGRTLTVVHRGRKDTHGHGFGLLQDVTKQVEADARIEKLETYHEVTGLHNRSWLLSQLVDAVQLARDACEPQGLALMAIELPRIADITANLGLGAGDALAMTLAARLKSVCHVDEHLGHLGDTGFALIVPTGAPADRAALRDRARLLQQAVQAPVRIGTADVLPTCVIGIACFPEHGDRAEELVERAQAARLEVSGDEAIGFHSCESAARARRALTIESALSQALERDEFELHYQAQVSLTSGKIRGAEALLRWRSAELGQVSPAEFIPVAERAGLSGTIGDWVLGEACRRIGDWRRRGLPQLRVAVNLSASQLQQPGLPQRIESLLVQHGASPAWFGVEVTESSAMGDVERAAATLREIKAMGIEVSLDDFGTGFSSLSYLSRLPVDVVKIDRSFMHDVTADAQDVSVTRTIISMAHGLQMKALAEGVETEGQLALLVAAGCDDCQGYWFAKPMPAGEFEALLTGPQLLPERYVRRTTERQRTLLLVDDEANVVNSLKRLFRRDGYRILTACSAEEGLVRLGENEVDVIISDQRMPGMTGVEFLRRAHELYPQTVRLVLSGYTELQSVIDAVNAGAIYKFLTKPWEDDRLRAHVAEAFRAKELADENRRLGQRVDSANVELAALNERLTRTLEQQRGQSEMLAASAEHIREMLIELPLPVFGLGDDATLAFVNREAERLLPETVALLGGDAGELLPAAALAAADGAAGAPLRRPCRIAGQRYDVVTRALPSGGAARPGQQLLVLIPDTDPLADDLAA